MASLALVQLWIAAALLLVLVQTQALGMGKYSRLVSYQGEIVVRCPDKNKATVQVLRDHADVWHVGKESIDVRIQRNAFARIQHYFTECSVIVEDVEAHVQAAEAKMFPQKEAEQKAWLENVVQAVIPKGDLRECEAKIEEWEQGMFRDVSWFREYHTYDDIVRWYRDLASLYPDLLTFNASIGKTHEGRDMPAVYFTGQTSNLGKKKFYIQCQIHAREWISGATCMYIVKYFVESYGVDERITALMDSLEFVLVPFVNPDGYVYTWTTDRMWRKNRHRNPVTASCVGVDINRNFPEGFKHKDDSCAEDYGGPYAKSELETRHIINHFKENSPIIGSIDFHSYGQLLLRPWGKDNATTLDDQFHRTIGREMVDIIRDVHGKEYTSEHSYDLYYCYGIVADWLYSDDAAQNNGGYRSASYCIELRDTPSSGGSGFLLPPDQILPTSEEILPAVIHYAETMLQHPITYTPSGLASSYWQQAAQQLVSKYIQRT